MSKKIISLILVFMLVFTASLVFADEEINYFVSMNFNSDAVGNKPSGFSSIVTKNPDEILVADPLGSGDKSVKFQSTSFTTIVTHYAFGATDFEGKDNVIVEFDVLIENYGVGNGVFSLYTYDSNNVAATLAKVDETGNFMTGDNTVLAKLMCGKFYKVALDIDFKNHKTDVYLNHKLIKEGAYLSNTVSRFGFLRFFLDKCDAETVNPIYYMDNFSLYFASAPEFVLNRSVATLMSTQSGSDSVMEKYVSGSVSFYVNQDTYAVSGKVQKMDEENENVKTVLFGGTSMVPADILCKALSLTFSEEENGILIKNATNQSLLLSESEITYIEDMLYIPVRKVSEHFGMKVSYDKSGLIMIGDKENYFLLDTSDIAYFRELTYLMCCDEPTEDEVYTDIIESNVSRPRVIINNDLLENLKYNLKTNPKMKAWYDSIKKKMERNLMAVLPSYSSAEASFLGTAQNARTRIPQLALIYLVDGDEAYAKRAVDEMVAMAEFENWHPKLAHATAEMNFAMSCGYDWLYNYMGEKGLTEKRDKIKNAIIDNGLKVVLEDYTGDYSYSGGRGSNTKFATLGDNPHNWVYVANGGALSAAVSLCDEETELCSKIISYGLKNWGKAMRFLAPHGAWYEGPMYTGWMMMCTVNAMSSLENAFGTSYGLMDLPGLTEVPYFIMECTSYTEPFNFGNVDPIYGNVNATHAFFMANHSGDAELGQLRTYLMEEYNLGAGIYDLIFAKPEYFSPLAPTVKDRIFTTPGDYSMLTMRTHATDDISVNLAAVASRNEVFEHAHSGSFILDAYGTRFVNDMGKGYYGGKSNWFHEYKARAEGHNIFVFNPDKSSGLVENSDFVVERFENNVDNALAILNLSAHYKTNADSVRRGFRLCDNRDRVIVQDEVKSAAPIENAYWFMHTPCEIELSSDGKSAILKGELKNMHVRLVTDDADAKFTIMPAEPLETSPTNTGTANDAHKKLTIHTQNKTDINYMVVMDFEYPYTEFTKPLPEYVPLDNWVLEAEDTSAKPKLTGISFNGGEFKEFNPDRTSYLYKLPAGTVAPKITATGDGTIEVTDVTEIPATAKIKITNAEGNSTEYGIVFEYLKEVVRPEVPLNSHDKCGLPIYIVSASQTLEVLNVPENLVDGDKKTRWVGSGEQYIEFDLGQVRTISAVSMAVYNALGDGRQQIFDVLISEDGINWTPVIENGKTSGKTEDEEMFSFNETRGIYVRIQYYGNTVNNYDSITEVRIFGK